MEMSPSDAQLERYRATCRQRDAEAQRRHARERREGIAAARRVAARLREAFGATRVVLFGSLVRDEPLGPRSDIDIAVAGISHDAYYQAVAQAQRVAGDWTVDLVSLDRCPSSLHNRVKSEGIPL